VTGEQSEPATGRARAGVEPSSIGRVIDRGARLSVSETERTTNELFLGGSGPLAGLRPQQKLVSPGARILAMQVLAGARNLQRLY